MSNGGAIVIRSQVELKKNYREYIDILRCDFCYSCAYCSLSESEAAGIGFEIDHYYPKKTHPTLLNNYDNLMYSCQHCNRHKLDYSPNQAQQLRGNVILRPDQDDLREHYEAVIYNLNGKTHTGTFNIVKLNLNRVTLRRIRELRRRFHDAVGYIAFGVPYLAALKLDLIPNPGQRILFSKIKEELNRKLEEVAPAFEQMVRDFGRSPLLDRDPDEKRHTKKRREYLEEQKVIDSDSVKRKLKRRGGKK